MTDREELMIERAQGKTEMQTFKYLENEKSFL